MICRKDVKPLGAARLTLILTVALIIAGVLSVSVSELRQDAHCHQGENCSSVSRDTQDSKVQALDISKWEPSNAIDRYTLVLTAFTGALALVAAIQATLFIWQLTLMREGINDAKGTAQVSLQTAVATADLASAAKASADIARASMVTSTRAYIQHNRFIWISHHHESNGTVFWRIRPEWVNAGNTPPRSLHVYAFYEVLDHRLPADFAFEIPHEELRNARPALIGPKGTLQGAMRDIEGAELLQIKHGTKFLYVWGVAKYRDVFPGTPERVTKFCFFVDDVSGDPLTSWNADSNNLYLRFLAYDRHNCADEDCEVDTTAHTSPDLPWALVDTRR